MHLVLAPAVVRSSGSLGVHGDGGPPRLRRADLVKEVFVKVPLGRGMQHHVPVRVEKGEGGSGWGYRPGQGWEGTDDSGPDHRGLGIRLGTDASGPPVLSGGNGYHGDELRGCRGHQRLQGELVLPDAPEVVRDQTLKRSIEF